LLSKVYLFSNYRNHPVINEFIGRVFYGAYDNLKSENSEPSAPNLPPMVFYIAQGREEQDANSTSFYNLAEVQEIVERVHELFENWPPAWGERKAASILVTAPYTEQVTNFILVNCILSYI